VQDCAGTSDANVNLPVAQIMAVEAVIDQKCIIASSDLREAEVAFAAAYSATLNLYLKDRH
jgi:hypothetical protein